MMNFDMLMMLEQTNLQCKTVKLDGRDVVQIKINDTAYMPGRHYREDGWFLMIEKDGTTWLWDGWISEA